MTELNRRTLLTTAGLTAAAGLTAGIGLASSDAAATPKPAASLQGAGFYRFRFGSKTVTVLGDGDGFLPGQPVFAANVTQEAFAAAQKEEFQPTDRVHVPMNTLLIEEGDRKILIDAGAGRFVGDSFGRQPIGLANAGVDPTQIDTVIITHGHFDHFGGLIGADQKSRFPNARIIWDEREHAYWSSAQAQSDVNGSALPQAFKDVSISALNTVLPKVAQQNHLVRGETEIAPGVQLLPAPGHTPHSSVVLIESDGKQLLYASDTTLLPAQNAKHPEWVSLFEADAEGLVATRRRLLDRAASDQVLWFAYHASFPALGHIRAAGKAWEYVPTTWSWA
ncbi:MAG: MBL fold metallo-hydrolase [Neomegalonema sp.]|nr:MBL fold metallo-hydrolase [Neomegalonema sp.]